MNNKNIDRFFAAVLTLAFIGVLAMGARFVGATGENIWNGPQTISGKLLVTPATKTASFTVSEDDNLYLINTSAAAITATLPTPSTLTTGKCWGAILATAGNAVTWSAAPYSINGATSTAEMDAAGDSYIICNNGTGYQLLSRYIH
jgi:hypothetical protein